MQAWMTHYTPKLSGKMDCNYSKINLSKIVEYKSWFPTDWSLIYHPKKKLKGIHNNMIDILFRLLLKEEESIKREISLKYQERTDNEALMLLECQTSALICTLLDSWSGASSSIIFACAGEVSLGDLVTAGLKVIPVKSIAWLIPLLILLRSSSRISWAAIIALMIMNHERWVHKLKHESWG